jgi:hypothetical protein
MAGRPPGHPKTGGAKKGSVKTNTKAVKDAIREVFFDDLGGKAYLRKIAKKDEQLFVSLLAKLIPQEIRAELDVRHHTFDLGAAMKDADAKLALSYSTPTPSPFADPQVIDHAPTPDRSDDA